MTKIPSDDILEGLYKLRIRESEKLKTVLELYNMEIHQKKAGPDYHSLRTMVKRSIEQNLRIENFDARNGNYERNAVVKNQGTKQRGQRVLGDCWQWEANGQCVKGDNCSFRHDMDKRGKSSPSNPSQNSFMQQSERKPSRTRSPRGKSSSGRVFRWPCKDFLKGTCTNSFCERWHPPESLFYKTKSGCRFGEKCSYAHRQVDEQPTKRSKKNDDKSAVAMLRKNEQHCRTGGPVVYDHSSNTRQLGCLFQDIEPTSTRSVDLGKHSVKTHFPEDRNCEISQRTKITRAPCRRRIGGAVPRAENFGDLITADHKVLSDNCESRNNHRYAVVVQDLATQWIQAYPCKTKTSQETHRSLQKFLEPERKPKVIYTDNSLEFGKACEDLSWNHCTSTPHRSETKDCCKSSAQSKGRYLCCIVAIRSEWKLVGRFHGMFYLSSKRHRSLVWWEDSLWKTFWRTKKRTNHSVWFIGWVSPCLSERPVKNPSIWKESLAWIVPWIRSVRGENLEGWHIGCRHWGVGDDGRTRNPKKSLNAKEVIFLQKMEN